MRGLTSFEYCTLKHWMSADDDHVSDAIEDHCLASLIELGVFVVTGRDEAGHEILETTSFAALALRIYEYEITSF